MRHAAKGPLGKPAGVRRATGARVCWIDHASRRLPGEVPVPGPPGKCPRTVREIIEMLGHSKVEMTLGLYSHLLPGLQEQTADKLDAMFAASQSEESNVIALAR